MHMICHHHLCLHSQPLLSTWRPVSVWEMKAFIGVKSNMGLIQLAQLKDYLGTHERVNLPFFHCIFSCDRFPRNMLHAGEMRGNRKCSKIQPLIDIAIPLFRQYFIPDRGIAVDVAMITYSGRVTFRQNVYAWQTSSMGHQSLCISS